MISTILDGKVLDWHYKKRKDKSYSFYIGDIPVGRLFKIKKNRWTAINAYNSSNEKPKRPNFIEGFGSRYYASEYLIVLNELHDALIKERQEEEEQTKRFEKFLKEHTK